LLEIDPEALYKHIAAIGTHPLAELKQESREMLLAALPNSLRITEDDRIQLDALKMIGKLMYQIYDRMKTCLDFLNEVLKVFQREVSRQTENVRVSVQSLLQAQAGRPLLIDDRDVCLSAVRATQAALAREGAETTFLGEEAMADLAALEAAMAGDFKKLERGDVREASPEMLLGCFESLMSTLKLDSSLQAAAQPALLQQFDKRTPFEHLVVFEVGKNLEQQMERRKFQIEYEAQVVQEGRARNERALAIDKDNLGDANTALEVHKARLAATQGIYRILAEQLSECQRKCKQAAEARDLQQRQVLSFMDCNMASFHVLESRESSCRWNLPGAGRAAPEC
jgi:hypothetical protein